jgi:S-adenosylmethionine:tRNA ribosyltransferase-isomerase
MDELKTDSYDYILPKELIASYPLPNVERSKLLVYDRASDTITHTTFEHILEYIPKDCAVMLNDTKVIKARIFGQKQTGGKVELLFNKPLLEDRFLVYIKGRIKAGTILEFEDGLFAKVIDIFEDGSREVEFYQYDKKLDFLNLVEILNSIGHIPLPPYMNREDNKDDEKTYQTLFAKNYGAVAAPTASLHFTDEILEDIKSNFETSFLTLHVGAGTFKPVEVDDILSHSMHSEYFEVPKDSKNILDTKKPILAVGTTVTRTIEYYHQTKDISGECDIFIHLQNKPKRVNHLLTNFHLPKSTLIMLVASFVGLEKVKEIYQEAIDKKYRFYSYGDGMLII